MAQNIRFAWLGIALTALVVPDSAKAAPLITSNIEYYDISGYSFKELRKDLFEQAALYVTTGTNHTASTHYKLRWKFKFRPEDGYCKITDVSTTVDVKIIFPRLADGASIADDVQQIFSEYAESLMIHENGHADIGINLAQQIEDGIWNLPPEPACPDLKENANALGNSLLAEGKQQNIDYDADTRHGATQGARFRE